jgi:hypothetical protein
MKNMSFALTTPQIRAGTKDITRRNGWKDLKPGQHVRAVVKAMGLKKGEKIQPIRVIECLDNRRERISAITAEDVIREGFPDWTPEQFIQFFCKHNHCRRHKKINRIVFKYV